MEGAGDGGAMALDRGGVVGAGESTLAGGGVLTRETVGEPVSGDDEVLSRGERAL